MSAISTTSMEIQYATEGDYKLKQLAIGREKRVVVKYFGDYEYVHIYDNRKDAKFKGITLGIDEFSMLQNIVQWMGKADDFFKKPLPKEEFKRAGVMTIESVTVDLFQPKVKGSSENVSSEEKEKSENVIIPSKDVVQQEQLQQTQDVLGKGEDQEDYQSLLDTLQSLEFQPKPVEEPQSLSPKPVEVLQNSSTSTSQSSSSPKPVEILQNNSTSTLQTSTSPKPVEVLENPSTSASIATKECVSTSPIYEPLVEPITPVKVKNDLKMKNPGFKRHRLFPYPSLPPYKY
ncbi:uncharacterized protein LOC134274183 [Saccostrea cucullata]|uniref:uncharacterized protein LOC134274183 n=1 Tax=Saccostrea cuccullata TaxID=36930 RepID=UPI002ED279B3